MKKTGMTLVYLLLAATAFASGSTTPATADSGFARAIRLLHERDDYAFTLTIENGTMQGDSFQVRPDQISQSRNYASRQDFIQYMNTGGALSFTGAAGRFRVYHDNKVILYSLFTTDSARAKAKTESLATLTPGMIDSVLFTRAILLHRKTSGGLTRYELGYPEGYPIRSLRLVFDRKADFISSIMYEVDRPAPGDRSMVIRQRISMSGYEQRAPDEAVVLGRLRSDELKDYLTKRYPGYKLQAIH